MSKHKRITQRFTNLAVAIQSAELECQSRGFCLRTRAIKVGKGNGWHWMFKTEDGRRILDYWPIKGTWYDSVAHTKGNDRDIQAVIDIAETILNERNRK